MSLLCRVPPAFPLVHCGSTGTSCHCLVPYQKPCGPCSALGTVTPRHWVRSQGGQGDSPSSWLCTSASISPVTVINRMALPQAVGQSPSLCWDQGAEAAGQGRGWKVLVRGHQIQAELETKLISCGRAKLQACWRKLPVRVPALGLAAAAVWLGPRADGEGVWEAGLAQHHGTGHQAQLPQRTPTGGLAGCTPASPCWDRPRVRLCTVSAGSHWAPPCSSGTHARAEGSRWMLPFKAALG